jgi:hypothetical protein
MRAIQAKTIGLYTIQMLNTNEIPYPDNNGSGFRRNVGNHVPEHKVLSPPNHLLNFHWDNNLKAYNETSYVNQVFRKLYKTCVAKQDTDRD